MSTLEVTVALWLYILYAVLYLVGAGVVWLWPLSLFVREFGVRRGLGFYYGRHADHAITSALGHITLLGFSPFIFPGAGLVWTVIWTLGKSRKLLALMLHVVAGDYGNRGAPPEVVRMLVEKANDLDPAW